VSGAAVTQRRRAERGEVGGDRRALSLLGSAARLPRRRRAETGV
jgi:hypothetical protein